ncbi:MAG: DUF1992 domain-containing protein [Proteobacteria bacterium]|nr:DUF1992 domain-containing protein [Pseudomonadota bacterium]MBU4468858.1 DUF1992 domain-containing protein [Pseudomonadota bacterium]MCG2750851.1 DUF1992 domain-containing protein [Desulfobacteraceae bacterium]
MYPGFEKIIEERIREARQAGKFDNLDGMGKPLDFSREPNLPGEFRLAKFS